MGRRKIEIKAIKDDRNRSVTFLKRKGGLFKKAHELSVLCSVDVAVIIFGNNKKLYEYSSSDLGEILTRYQYYGGANEHKGPADFNGKDKLDDDDDDDASIPSHHGSAEPQMMPPQFQNQVPYQHIRHHTPSASPPVPSMSVFAHQSKRQHTPQPQLPDKRPSSGNAGTRTGSNLAPQRSQPPNGYAYMPNPSIYNSQGVPMPSSHPHNLPSHLQASSLQGPPMQQSHALQGSQYSNYQPPSHQQLHPHQQQMRNAYQEDRQKANAPTPTPQERQPTRSGSTPPQQASERPPPLPEVEIKQESQPAQQILEPVKKISVKSRSIFTPIDESRSILSQHWASSTSKVEATRNEIAISASRLQSVEISNNNPANNPSSPSCAQSNTSTGHGSVSAPENSSLPSRTNSASQGGIKRPVLKVQIPDEPSDEGSATAESISSPNGTNATSSHSRHNGNTTDSLSSSLVLPPPPSPSAGSLISAGATGPPNPFARPPPVAQSSQNNINSSNSNSNVGNNNSNNSAVCNNNNSANGNNNSSNSTIGNNNSSNNNNNTTSNTISNNSTNNSNGGINNINHPVETPISALPSRFITNDFLPSPSSFYPEWNFRGGDGNTLPSPLNFATPVLGSGPSFMREDPMSKEATKENKVKRNIAEGEADVKDIKRLKKG